MTDRDDTASDPLVEAARVDPALAQTVTNDAVAGETVLPQPGDGPSGPTGGNEREAEPMRDVNDLVDADVELDEDDDAGADAAAGGSAS